MKLAVVGATGLVGREMIRVIEEMNIGDIEFFAVASERSLGKTLLFKGEEHKVISMQAAVDIGPDIAVFSAGASTSLQWAPEFAAVGTYVIDNSSAWRMKEEIPLVVPEINAASIGKNTKIIANPNCSTIQLVLTLAPLHLKYTIRRLVIATYQSVSGSGLNAVRQLEQEREGIKAEMAYPHPIDLNVLPFGGVFTDSGYTTEEIKLEQETQKILNDPNIKATATVVRVPVYGGHSEAVNIEFEKSFDLEDIRDILANTEGIVIQDEPATHQYPMPLYAQGHDEVFVGRIRRDKSIPNGVDLWIVSDNLRKGAATNAVQIAKYLIDKGFVNKN